MVYCTTVKTQTQTNLYLQYIQYCIHGKEVCVGNLRTRNSCVLCCSCQRQIRVKTEPTAMFFLEEYILYTVQYILFVISSSQEGFSALSPQNLAIHCHSALSLRVVLHTAEFYTVYLYFIWMYGWFLRYVHGTVKSDFAMTHRGVSFDFWRRKKSR